jgi:hypothetical protein
VQKIIRKPFSSSKIRQLLGDTKTWEILCAALTQKLDLPASFTGNLLADMTNQDTVEFVRYCENLIHFPTHLFCDQNIVSLFLSSAVMCAERIKTTFGRTPTKDLSVFVNTVVPGVAKLTHTDHLVEYAARFKLDFFKKVPYPETYYPEEYRLPVLTILNKQSRGVLNLDEKKKLLCYSIHRKFLDLLHPDVFCRIVRDNKGDYDARYCSEYGLILHRHAPLILSSILNQPPPPLVFQNFVQSVIFKHMKRVYPHNKVLKTLTIEYVRFSPGGARCDPSAVYDLESLLTWKQTIDNPLADRFYAYLPGASYSPYLNRVFVPATMWSSTYYDPTDLVHNLAGIGFILAHEFGHAIMKGRDHGELDADRIGARTVFDFCAHNNVDTAQVFGKWKLLLQQSYKQCKYKPHSATHPLNETRIQAVAKVLQEIALARSEA